MDRESRRMLHYFANGYQGVLSRKAACRAYAERYGVSMPRVSACFDYLAEEDYLQPFGRVDEGFFRIRHKGYHYRYFEWEEMRSLLFRSLLVPAAVSGLAGVITYLLTCAAAGSQPPP